MLALRLALGEIPSPSGELRCQQIAGEENQVFLRVFLSSAGW